MCRLLQQAASRTTGDLLQPWPSVHLQCKMIANKKTGHAAEVQSERAQGFGFAVEAKIEETWPQLGERR